jgi:2-keto-4-pentenoate hydratase/2-oxohepta-3-ene-1,7-dioic acid hydratase in catechol pathway
MGPWIISKALVPFPVHLDIKCYVNGEIRQHANTSSLIFDIPTIISDLSKGYKLMPGDIILTGTPAGVGMGFDPPKFLEAGDELCCAIEGIGSLFNTIEE